VKIQNYKDLVVWQLSRSLVKEIYRITGEFPKSELYSLVNQVRRAVVSVPSNIAEGFVRKHTREYVQFLRMALGSCAELETQLILAKDLDYLNDSEGKKCFEQLESITRMLVRLIQRLEER
jgi:four helix bundle protein